MLLLFLVLALSADPAPAAVDPAAAGVADQVMAALGGEAAWKATRFLRFDFAVESEGKIAVSRSHYWDKWTGRYRVEGKDKQGSYLVLMNVNTKEGSAWRNGKPAEGEALKGLLEQGYGLWVNDTYWLIMPYKLRDPGVNLKLEGETKDGDAVYDRLLLTFEGVGLTPKDRYWVFVNRATHLVDRWEYILQDEKGPATRWEWRGWKGLGRIQLAPERVSGKGNRRILFPVLDVPATIADAVFTSPEAPR
jgi:plasmid maintenance system killer protein